MKLPIRALLKALLPLLPKLLPLLAPLVAKLGPYGKAVAPFVTGLLGSLLTVATSGAVTTMSLGSLGLGLVASVVVYYTPNKAKPTPAPVPPPAPPAATLPPSK